MTKFSLEQVSSLDKVFLKPQSPLTPVTEATVLKGDRYSYQIAYAGTDTNGWPSDASFEISSDISEYINVYKVENLPSAFPVYSSADSEGYITKEPGLFPDLLEPVRDNYIKVVDGFKRALWLTVDVPENAESGEHNITVTVKCDGNEKSVTLRLEILDCVLPKYPFKYTQWFHADCIADYYGLEVFSEEFWSMTEKFIKTAAYTGINMILTPIFTPPLDTAVGGERTTVQLIDVKKNGEKYEFGFEKLARWIDICQRCGIEYFEMAHLFTQWGAEHAPKIVADVNGEKVKIFGWETDLADGEYKRFLEQLIPQLSKVLKDLGVDKNTYFHISDEPSEKHLESYKAARETVADLLGDFPVLDALSHYDFYEQGLTKVPVPAIDHIEPFFEKRPSEMWTYYCCGQMNKVTNRFFSMPSARNRIAGVQFYKYEIDGFLHWGYNFYNNQFSHGKINPFMVTDAGMAFPSGDSYSVYPGEDGPLLSLRAEVFADGLRDMRALKFLESLTDRQTVLDLIGDVTLTEYPLDAQYLVNLRESVNRKIAEKLSL